MTKVQEALEGLKEPERIAAQALFLVKTKKLILNVMDGNAASFESLAEKMKISKRKLVDVISNPSTDIDVRFLADIMTALGKTIKLEGTDERSSNTCIPRQ